LLHGQVIGRDKIACPGPGHSRKDRSLVVKFDSRAPQGFVTFSHSGDDWKECRKHICGTLGIPPWQPGDEQRRTIAPQDVEKLDLACVAAISRGTYWCAGSVGMIAYFPLIDAVRTLVILGEAGTPSMTAINICGTRWRRAGKEVRIATPDPPHSDFNDQLIAEAA
jgi:hypothetical protein